MAPPPVLASYLPSTRTDYLKGRLGQDRWVSYPAARTEGQVGPDPSQWVRVVGPVRIVQVRTETVRNVRRG